MELIKNILIFCFIPWVLLALIYSFVGGFPAFLFGSFITGLDGFIIAMFLIRDSNKYKEDV